MAAVIFATGALRWSLQRRKTLVEKQQEEHETLGQLRTFMTKLVGANPNAALAGFQRKTRPYQYVNVLPHVHPHVYSNVRTSVNTHAHTHLQTRVYDESMHTSIHKPIRMPIHMFVHMSVQH